MKIGARAMTSEDMARYSWEIREQTFNDRSFQMIDISYDDAETLIAFIKSHEREEIPEDVWEVCMKLWEEVYD